MQAGREYTNIRYSTDGGLAPTATAPQQLLQPLIDSPIFAGRNLLKSALSLNNVTATVPTQYQATLPAIPKIKSSTNVKEKNSPSRTVSDQFFPMYKSVDVDSF